MVFCPPVESYEQTVSRPRLRGAGEHPVLDVISAISAADSNLPMELWRGYDLGASSYTAEREAVVDI
jgi:hypothetical protein